MGSRKKKKIRLLKEIAKGEKEMLEGRGLGLFAKIMKEVHP